MKSMIESAPNVPKNPLKRGKMLLSRFMHVETHLLNRVGDVGTGKSQVFKSTRNTTVKRRVGNRRTRAINLGCGVSRCVCAGL